MKEFVTDPVTDSVSDPVSDPVSDAATQPLADVLRVVFCCTGAKAQPWLDGLRILLPGADVSEWQPGAPPADYAIVWAPPQQFLDEQTA